ncbi:ATP-binding protein [Sphingomonas sp. TREG-RG-20F-R18-01]|uniref:ATP-binding protein n=1 Tax=Sphingomonas sp. TREG-RG-20F-R18-01 TaxID=2914982 RepID=UPI001F5A80D3|nr:ATP-binding protein [Sphingomonas sp. TREG-RG-20F-R18-01]
MEELDFEERADHLTDDQILTGTIVEDYLDDVSRALRRKGLVLIVGPRGCGKTHMMRYASLLCRDDATAPFATYVSFNRYLRLEPLLNSRSDAMLIFHAWVLALIILGVARSLEESDPSLAELFWRESPISGEELSEFVDRAERAVTPSEQDERVAAAISLSLVKDLVRAAVRLAGRTRAIILLDDAALTLTPEFLVEFFDIVRVLKSSDISPKASVYPGTTEYGPRFHADHEGRSIPVWLSVNDSRYGEIMQDIANQRLPDVTRVPVDVREALMYAAFGVPRAYLTLLREWIDSGANSTDQAIVTRLIREHRDARWAEYKSLALKLPKLSTIINTGGNLFNAMVEALRQANGTNGGDHVQLQVAVLSSDFNAMTQRMLNLLVEAGLVREEGEVSHGPDRKLRRLTPHVGALIADRAIIQGRGGGPRRIAQILRLPRDKHPVRRSIASLVGAAEVEALHYDLPSCQFCKTERLNDTQRFCHGCGKKLLDGSTYSRCMEIPVTEIPGLSRFSIESLHKRKLLTVGSIVGLQDPGTELRKSWGVGERRSNKVLEQVNAFVDEFLS